jgi:hypothetical protein
MNGSAGTLSDIQTRLASLTCPFCEHGKLDLVLRCEAHADACLLIAKCESCHMQYLVDRDTGPFTDAKGQSQAGVTKVTCPPCGGTDCSVSFQCTVASRRCAYQVACATCRNTETQPRPDP